MSKKLYVSYIGEDGEIVIVMGKCTERGALRAMKKYESECVDEDEMVCTNGDLSSVPRIIRYSRKDHPDTDYFDWSRDWGDPYPADMVELIDEAPGWISTI